MRKKSPWITSRNPGFWSWRNRSIPPNVKLLALLICSTITFLVVRLWPGPVYAPFRSYLSSITVLPIVAGSGLDWSLWSLGWVGTAPLIMAVVRERRFWRSLLLGMVTGTIFYAGSSHWVTYSMHHYGDIPLWQCYIILVIFSATLGVFTGLFAGALGLTIKRFGGWAILAAPFIWATSEWLRLQATGMGWNPLGYFWNGWHRVGVVVET